ncbi:hypothetical protein D3C81_1790620 [compost metagenome]
MGMPREENGLGITGEDFLQSVMLDHRPAVEIRVASGHRIRKGLVQENEDGFALLRPLRHDALQPIQLVLRQPGIFSEAVIGLAVAFRTEEYKVISADP